jgi:hypothetical protein
MKLREIVRESGYHHGHADPQAPTLGGREKRSFKHAELRHELSDETNNIAIAINGKTWKVVPCRGYADSREEREYLQHMQNWAEKKSASSGKKWSVHLTGAPITESATAGATSAGNIASVANPTVAYSKTTKQPKKKDGTAVNGADIKGVSLFGGPMIKR